MDRQNRITCSKKPNSKTIIWAAKGMIKYSECCVMCKNKTEKCKCRPLCKPFLSCELKGNPRVTGAILNTDNLKEIEDYFKEQVITDSSISKFLEANGIKNEKFRVMGF